MMLCITPRMIRAILLISLATSMSCSPMQKILLTALIAGFVAGFVGFALQQIKLSPLILQAETYEEAEDHHHDQNIWQPENGLERDIYRLLTDIGVGVGYALMLVGAFTLRGGEINSKNGLLWGIAGFASFSLAPSFGLSPELPGSMAADLAARQIWWLATACATVAAIALLAFGKPVILKILAVILLSLPHIIGAPEPNAIGGTVPAELNAAFAAASLGVAAIFWVTLGAISGWFYGRNKYQP